MRCFKIIVLLSFIILLKDFAFAQKSNSDTLYIASEPHYPPYCMVDEKGEASGFSIDLINAVAKEAGFKLHIKVGTWDLIKNQLAKNELDALPLVGKTPEREEYFDFTMPYISLHGAIFTRKKYIKINNRDDLKGKVLLVMKGDNAEEFLRRENFTDNIITYNTFSEAFNALSAGVGDAVITQRILGEELLEDEKIRNVHALDIDLSEFRQDFCFAVTKGDTLLLNKLNEALSIVISTHKYDEIYYKWFGKQIIGKHSLKDVISILLYVLIPVIMLLVFAWIVFLKREVRKRTLSLEDSMQQLKSSSAILKDKEEQIRLLLNSTAEGIFSVDKNGKCTLINDSAIKLLAYENKNELLNKNIHSIIHHNIDEGDADNFVNCPIYNSIISGEIIHTEDESFYKKTGSSFNIELFSYPIKKDGEINGSVITFWDITKRKKDEKELRKLKDELEKKVEERTAELKEKIQKLDRSEKAMLYMVEDLNNITKELKEERRKLEISNKELEAFGYSVSHDLRAPLRAINGFAQFLVEDYSDVLDDEGERFIKTIRDNASKMDVLITDILNLSRVSRAEFNPSKINMKNIIEEKLTDVFKDYNKAEFEIEIKPISDSKVDKRLIEMVWSNLISNAVKYSQKSEIKKLKLALILKTRKIYIILKTMGLVLIQNIRKSYLEFFKDCIKILISKELELD